MKQMSKALLAASWLAAQTAYAQFVTAPTDLNETTGYLSIPVRSKQVPDGICETTPGVKSYSGYVDIAEHEHIFFWFFEARNEDPTTAPLTVWINGGPGSSSMIGLFQENGPCGVDYDGNLYNNPYSWNNASNMLFIDEPTGTGFSYSDAIPAYVSDYGDVVQLPSESCPDYAADLDCGTYSYASLLDTANSTSAAAPRFWRTLQGFMGAYPQYSRESFHFTTESYGGHYGPIFNEYIETQNAAIRNGSLPGAHAINLASVMIGNGWYDPLIQYAAYYNFTVYPGNTYDYSPFDASTQAKMYNGMYGAGNCYDLTVSCYETGINEICSYADDFCYYEVEAVLDDAADRDEYDIRELQPDPFPYEFYVDYLNTPEVQAAIGAFVNFTEGSDYVGDAFGSTGDDDREDGTLEAVRELVSQGVYVVHYAGDADYNCNWLGGQAVAEKINATNFNSAGFTNITTSDGIVHGQVKQSDNYAFARVYYSGHEVPFYQPVLALEMFERVLAGKDVATGLVGIASNYTTVGPSVSTFREGNATVQFDVVPTSATYNVTTGAPNPYSGSSSQKRGKAQAKRSHKKRTAALLRQNKRWA
ncbi:alpha/beta-hydrolase [Cryphonectria parasitica EP155]|uniref:Alpha/beta-hydrolase n=1 Tax=Cryphonectria parasitica (strain ATCC 38755 / EP155) TaxID=660469 RepID=A0A9P5CL21_CRYP1|nr:alpha/beta-hydrolase [Cryphonectria parasitica EP155]KAF3762618.1 alpha/beta-hydrolase [Cryphonectria parasitica EP155]